MDKSGDTRVAVMAAILSAVLEDEVSSMLVVSGTGSDCSESGWIDDMTMLVSSILYIWETKLDGIRHAGSRTTQQEAQSCQN